MKRQNQGCAVVEGQDGLTGSSEKGNGGSGRGRQFYVVMIEGPDGIEVSEHGGLMTESQADGFISTFNKCSEPEFRAYKRPIVWDLAPEDGPGSSGVDFSAAKSVDGDKVERVSAVAVVSKKNPRSLEDLHGSDREAVDNGGIFGDNYEPKPIEVAFDGTRFDVVMVSCHRTWFPSSLLDVPPIGKMRKFGDDQLESEGYSSGYELPGEFMTREEALEYVLDCNRREEEEWGVFRGQPAAKDEFFASMHLKMTSLYDWAVMVEVGQRIDGMKTTAEATICGTIGQLCQELVYPIRVAKLTPEEVERYKIEVASEEPAVA